MLVNKFNERGFVKDMRGSYGVTTGIIISPDIKQFGSYAHAQEFLIRENCERDGTRAYIYDNDDLLKMVEAVSAHDITKPVYAIQNPLGERLQYSAQLEGYFFLEKGADSFSVWNSAKDAVDVMKAYGVQGEVVEIKKASVNTPA